MKEAYSLFKKVLLSIALTVGFSILAWSHLAFAQVQLDSYERAVLNFKSVDKYSLSTSKLNQTFKYQHILSQPENNSLSIENKPLAPCQTLEIRVASSSQEGLFFKEGVGSIFKKAADNKRFFILTVAHLINNQEVMIGVCNNNYYKLNLLASDKSIDTAILEITNPDKNLNPLFVYEKGSSPQILQVENLNENRSTSLSSAGVFAIETLSNTKLLNSSGNFYLQIAEDYSNSQFYAPLWYDRRSVLHNFDGNLVAEKSFLLPGSQWVYKLTKNGVKPGMSGSPVFFYRKTGYGFKTNLVEYDPNIIMVGIVSKTHINTTESAMIPFNQIYKNLGVLLDGKSNDGFFISDNELHTENKVFRNLGATPYKYSADEIPIPNEKIQPAIAVQARDKFDIGLILKSDKKLRVERLLKNPQQVYEIKKSFQKSYSSGADWGDGNGNLLHSLIPQVFQSTSNGIYSMYIDPTMHRESGIIDNAGNTYYGIQQGSQFYQIKSVYSLAPFLTNLNRNLTQYGIKNKSEAFLHLCNSPDWNRSKKSFFTQENHSYGTQWSDSMLSKYGNRNSDWLYARCSDNQIKFFSDMPELQGDLTIDEKSVSGEIYILGCKTNIEVSSENIWERYISNENFDAKIEIGDGKDFLLKFYFFKIKKACSSATNSNEVMSTKNILSTVTIK